MNSHRKFLEPSTVQEDEVEVKVEHPLTKIAGRIETIIDAKLDAKGYAVLLFYNHFLLTPTTVEKGSLNGTKTVGLMPRFDSWDGEV